MMTSRVGNPLITTQAKIVPQWLWGHVMSKHPLLPKDESKSTLPVKKVIFTNKSELLHSARMKCLECLGPWNLRPSAAWFLWCISLILKDPCLPSPLNWKGYYREPWESNKYDYDWTVSLREAASGPFRHPSVSVWQQQTPPFNISF